MASALLRLSDAFGFLFFAIFFAMATSAAASAAPTIYAPADGGNVLGRDLVVDVRGCAKTQGDLVAYLDDVRVLAYWVPGRYRGQWLAKLELGRDGVHVLRFTGRCRATAIFSSSRTGTLEIASRLAAHYLAAHPARKMAWDWGPAVFLYGLYRLDPYSPDVRAFQRHWARKGVSAPDKNDAVPAALTALALARDQGDQLGLESARTVAHYVLTEPRNKLGAIDHLGHNFFHFLYGDSIWVDSLMMIGVFGAQWASYTHDAATLDFAARQPGIYASVLQDPATGLFRHAWKITKGVAIPKSPAFWLRGNGWVITSIAEILDELPPTHPRREELLGIFRRTVAGLLACQQPNGLWDSLANLPGATYGETSGTSLSAYAIAKGVHRGWLPAENMARAKLAFAGVTARLLPKRSGSGALLYSMPRISWSTNPMPKFGYTLIPAVSDMSYGVGAYLLAAAELQNEEF
ncbi:MAG: glycoside hydrolase family 88 protein [Deltaproteobacteria bacterium]|nr:glycoside hydrolase family 88 protein [Deltaproteobacteria bacterium]